MCLNCQKQDETCDYSVRLNWDGRGKKKPEPTGEGHISFPSAAPPRGFDAHVQDKPASTSSSQLNGPSYQITLGQTTAAGALQGYNNNYNSELIPISLQNLKPPTFGQPDLQSSSQPRGPPATRTKATESSVSRNKMNSSGIFTSTTYGPGGLLINAGALSGHDYHEDSPQDSNTFLADECQAQHPGVIRMLPLPLPNSDVFGGATNVATGGLFTEFANDASINRPLKRVRLELLTHMDNPVIAMEMPPPTILPSSAASGQSTHTLPSPPVANNTYQQLIPLESSSYSDERRRYATNKLSPFKPPESPDADPRRLSVESLLSGPAGMAYHGPTYAFSDKSTEYTPAVNGDYDDEMEQWGLDRGFRDLDIGRNDDVNAISGSSPAPLRDYTESARVIEDDHSPSGFGFGVQAKDTAFERGGYYASPVPIRIPQAFLPLPPTLTENPMNLLYFHHFISHTARILVPHHCSSNPFQSIMPQMALRDPNLMNLLLAYSASHRARLLQQPEPSTRIALWVQDIFSNLSHALDDPNEIISDSSLAAAIMLASLEIISPKTFGVAVPWQQHLDVARQMIAARGGAQEMRHNSISSLFLLRWFAYLDIIGRLIGGHQGSSFIAETVIAYDTDDINGHKIDCLLGFTSRCVSILAKISVLAASCAAERLDDNNNIRSAWEPSEETRKRAEELIKDLENARTSTLIQHCPHLRSLDESTYQWENREMAATNEAYHLAGLIHLHRRVLGKQSDHEDVQAAVRDIVGLLDKIRKGSSAEACLLFPMFTAGCDAQDENQRTLIMDRMKTVEEFGMSQVRKARRLMQKVWDTGKPWETLVRGEFVG